MGLEAGPKTNRLAGVCDRCGNRLRLGLTDPDNARRALVMLGWVEFHPALVCRACHAPPQHEGASRAPAPKPPKREDVRTPRATAAASSSGRIVAAVQDKFTLSYVDGAGRKRFVLWKAPDVELRVAAERALASGEAIDVTVAGEVRVRFNAALSSDE